MTRRKNTKRIDPRHFLEETIIREGEDNDDEEYAVFSDICNDVDDYLYASGQAPWFCGQQGYEEGLEKGPIVEDRDDPVANLRDEEEELNARLAALRGGPAPKSPREDPLANLRAAAAGEEREPRGRGGYDWGPDRDDPEGLYADEIEARDARRLQRLNNPPLDLDPEERSRWLKSQQLDNETIISARPIDPVETVAATPWGGFADKESRDQAWWDQYLMDYPDVAAQGAPMPDVLPWDEPEERAIAKEPGPVAPPPSQKFDGSIPVREEQEQTQDERGEQRTVGARGSVRRGGAGGGTMGTGATYEKYKSGEYSPKDYKYDPTAPKSALDPFRGGTSGVDTDLRDLQARKDLKARGFIDPGKHAGAIELQNYMGDAALPGEKAVADRPRIYDRGFAAPKKESLTRSNLRRMVMEEIAALNEPPEALTQAQAVVDADNAKKSRVNETLTRWQKIIK